MGMFDRGRLAPRVAAVLLGAGSWLAVGDIATAQPQGAVGSANQAAPGAPLSWTRPPPPAIPPPPPPPTPPGYNPAVPKYPGWAIYTGHQGTAMLLILLSADGEPKDIKVERSSGFRELDQAAINAAKMAQYPLFGEPRHSGDWYARRPYAFRIGGSGALFDTDQPGFWGPAYLKPRYVEVSERLPNPDLAGMLAYVSGHYRADQGNTPRWSMFSVPKDATAAPAEVWLFLDMETPRNGIALHFVRGSKLPAPTVGVSAHCAAGREACNRLLPAILRGPPFASGT